MFSGMRRVLFVSNFCLLNSSSRLVVHMKIMAIDCYQFLPTPNRYRNASHTSDKQIAGAHKLSDFSCLKTMRMRENQVIINYVN